MRLICLSLLAMSCATLPRSAPTPLPGFVREVRMLDVTFDDGSHAGLEVAITRPDDAVAHALILITHGSPRDNNRRLMTPTVFADRALTFAQRGYAVVVVMRRSYGRSDGDALENSGKCGDRHYLHAVRTSAEDLRRTIAVLAQLSWVDRSRIVLMGISTGGMASVGAGAENIPGVVAVVSFAGGRGSDAPDHVCQPERLVDTFRTLGESARVPNLWLYAANDHFFGPALAQQFASAYREHQAPLDFVALPDWAKDGHRLWGDAPLERWWPSVKDFFERLGLPTDVQVPVEPTRLPAEPTERACATDQTSNCMNR